ncbi:hypothetical protein [Mucilaginibacter antarcticus]|uniref:hypothetical protein n=1 Tax=Mucilaginibacter antarcticus TaxID=1855725 RepID=UPI0036333F84
MRKNKPHCLLLILLVFTLFNTACAQTSGLNYLKEEQLAQQSTVLFNNTNNMIPLRNIGNLKIASIHLSNPQAAGFDSLLNKYTRVTSISVASYDKGKQSGYLAVDLRPFNTIIFQLTEPDLNNQQLIKLITDNQKVKNVIIAYFGNGEIIADRRGYSADTIC